MNDTIFFLLCLSFNELSVYAIGFRLVITVTVFILCMLIICTFTFVCFLRHLTIFFSCLLGQHPRLRWNRKRRSLEMRFMRSRYILQNYRELQRRYHELIESGQVDEHRSRLKRNVHTFDILPSQYHQFIYPHHKNIVHRRVSRNLNNFIHRQLRRPFQGEEAYAKYMENIKQKYQKYVKNILGYNNIQNYSAELNGRPYDNHESLTRLQPSNHESHFHQFDATNAPPTASTYNTNFYAESKENRNYPFADNIFFGDEYNANQRNPYRIVNNNFVSGDNVRDYIDYSIKPNVTDLIAKLKSQIIRRKRSVVDDADAENEKRNRKFRKRANSNYTAHDAIEINENLEGLKRGKPKGPCEVSRKILLSVFRMYVGLDARSQ